MLIGEVHEAGADLEGAAAAYAAALEQADSLRTRILGDERDRALYVGELSLGRLAGSLARVRISMGDPRAAFTAAERGRERALLDLLERAGTDLVATARERDEDTGALLAAQLDRVTRAEHTRMLAEQELRREAGRTEATEQRLEELERDVREARRAWLERERDLATSLRAVWPSAQPLATGALMGALRADEALVHYTFDSAGVGLVILRGGGEWFGCTLAADALATSALSAELVRAIEALRSGQELGPETRESLSEALLPAAAWEQIAGCRRLVVVPDGPLHELPFEVLLTPLGDWLDHGPRLVYSPSAALFVRSRAGRVDGDDQRGRAVVLGDPSFTKGVTVPSAEGTRGAQQGNRSTLDRVRLFGDQLEPLPGSAVEARRIAAELGAAGWKVERLLGTEARAPRLLECAPGATLVHLATHGLAAVAERPYESALALSTPEAWSDADDGFLTLDDLVRRWGGVLAGCDLVVLSACDTQVGVPHGESRVALSWGFFFAGADSVLVSLWKVDDRATVLLMDRFYANYTGRFEGVRKAGEEHFVGGQPMPEDAALQEAKSWLSHSTPARNRARLEELGFGVEAAGERGDFPRPGAAPSTSPTDAAFDFRAPRFGSAFALYGQPD